MATIENLVKYHLKRTFLEDVRVLDSNEKSTKGCKIHPHSVNTNLLVVTRFGYKSAVSVLIANVSI